MKILKFPEPQSDPGAALSSAEAQFGAYARQDLLEIVAIDLDGLPSSRVGCSPVNASAEVA
jgi:hypothetical protein